MKKILVSQSLIEVESLKERLEQAGIRCMVKNQQGSTLAGGVPFVEVFPELWIVKNEDYGQAKELMSVWTKVETKSSAAWICSECGEKHSGEFTACWRCGREKGSKSTPRNRFSPEMDHASSVSWQIVMGMFLGAAMTFLAFFWRDYVSLKDISEDRNGDGKVDVIDTYKSGWLHSEKRDDDFDGFFETSYEYSRAGWAIRGEIDLNEDGKPDRIEDFTLGKLVSVNFIDPATGKVKKRAFYKFDAKTREEIDEDGDGKFERIIQFDQFESPLP